MSYDGESAIFVFTGENMKSYPKPIMFYHGDCPDGFGAAFAFYLRYGNFIEYEPVIHKQEPFKGIPPELFHQRHIWMIDFSLEREDLLIAANLAESLQVIDHHISNEEMLKDLDFCYFDQNHSGAVLAWKYCFPDVQVPILLSYIEDRDLWKKKLPFHAEILSAIDSHKKTFESWIDLKNKLETPEGFSSLIKDGEAILKNNEFLKEFIKKQVYYGKIKGFEVPIVNTPFFRSEILHDLAKNYPFAAAYHFDGENFIFSLRSEKNGLNVSEISKQFPGGGGHKNAAGFSISNLELLK